MGHPEIQGSLTVFPRHEAEPPEEILDDVIEQSVLDRREKLRHKAAVNAVVVDKKPRLPIQRPQYSQPSTSRQYDDDDEGDDNLFDRLDDQDDTLDDQLAELEKLSKQCPTVATSRPRSQKVKASTAIKVVKTEASLDQQLAVLDQLGSVPAVDPPTRRKARASKVKTASPAATTPGSSSLSDQLAALEQLGKIPSSKPTRKPRAPKTVKVVKTEVATSLNDQLMALDRLGEMPTEEQPTKPPPRRRKSQTTKSKSQNSVKSKEPETLDDQLVALEQLSNTNKTQKSKTEKSSTLDDQLAILDSL